jgi:ubiquinone/menaquinone biosynthesis C-methylase UbiE
MTENLFKDEVVANQFNDYNDVLEQVLGYNFVLSILKSTQAKKILDYGCGPGKVSLRLANQLSADIVAVDESAKMIEIAKRERKHQQIDYKIVKKDNLDFISDNSVDGAIACYVFINNQSEQRILKIMREIYRTLRPNSHFIILDTNPNTTGVPFSTFQNGEPGKSYSYGEERVEKLNLDSQEKLYFA